MGSKLCITRRAVIRIGRIGNAEMLEVTRRVLLAGFSIQNRDLQSDVSSDLVYVTNMMFKR
jgi:hypothetical protein